MMYRCGWGSKEGQETVFAVAITRDGFERALRLSVEPRPGSPPRSRHLTATAEAGSHARAVGPGAGPAPAPHAYRSLQLGLSREAVRRYADELDISLHDVTPLARKIHSGDMDSAARLLPQEHPYPVEDQTLAPPHE